LLLVFSVAFGWFTLLNGGVVLKGRGGRVSEATGGAGVALALAFIALAVLLSPLVVRSLGLSRRSALLLAVFVALPPLGFVLLRP
jgi:hypothetical protein